MVRFHRNKVREQYSNLPKELRERWDPQRFSELSRQREMPAVAFDPSAEVCQAHGKLPDPEKSEFGGIASAFNTKIESWVTSIIEPGAFKDTLADSHQRSRVRVFLEHSQPIGVPTFMEEVKEGLLVMGKVSDTALGRDAMTLVRDKVIAEMSIGFDVTEWSYREEDKDFVRIIHAIRLWEFSLVAHGANPKAKITTFNSLKGIDPSIDEHVEAALKRFQELQSGREATERHSPATLIRMALDQLELGVQADPQELQALYRQLGVRAGVKQDEVTISGDRTIAPIDLSFLDQAAALVG